MTDYNKFSTVDHIKSFDSTQTVKPGIYLGKVTGLLDPTNMGVFYVKLYRESGNMDVIGQSIPVKYMTPFYGSTSVDYVADVDDYDNTQKSYGMWMVPPDIGTTVIVVFIDGNEKYGYWIGCVPDESMNFMVPGIAATKEVVDSTGGERRPVAEYNRQVNNTIADPTKAKKPEHPFAKVLDEQGLDKDDIRGITTSSARREAPSAVFGISTPGPVDKQPGAKKGKVGNADNFVTTFVSRLGGATFVMDDGDDKFLRKTPAGEGPPEYASVENGETDGDVTLPHNELIRLRTRTGHQILLHNSEDLIYIGNAKGTTWIELTSNGKIDIYAEDSVSIHTKNDLNIKADRDINLEAGRNFNVKAGGKLHQESGADLELLSGADTKITSLANSHINSGTTHRETAGKIYMNSDQKAVAATALSVFDNPTETGGTESSIMLRVPTHEPWPHHENLDPMNFMAVKTDRETGAVIAVPTAWKEYSTKIDTFSKVLPPGATSVNEGE